MTELIWFCVGMASTIAVYLLGRLSGMHRHRWSEWEDVATVTFLEQEGDTLPTGWGIRQHRRCRTCQQLELQVVKS